MKKIGIFHLIILPLIPLAFSKMEGPFKGGTKENFYYFLYDQTTGYTIGYIPRPEIPNNDIIRFLKGNPDFFDNNLIPQAQFYFTKEKSNLNLKEITELTELTELTKISRYFNHFLNKGTKFEAIESPLITAIPLRKKFPTLSGTKIKNQYNSVEICDFPEMESVDIHRALHRYFSNKISNDEKLYEFFNHSKILSFYGVIKSPYTKNSILWGLAEEKNTTQKFHWIINFKDDISRLLNYSVVINLENDMWTRLSE